jgi:hypothetical protein
LSADSALSPGESEKLTLGATAARSATENSELIDGARMQLDYIEQMLMARLSVSFDEIGRFATNGCRGSATHENR